MIHPRPIRRLHPPLVAALLGLLVTSTAPSSAADYPFFKDNYRGDPDTVLATFQGQPVSEQDLYLFLLLNHFPLPALAKGWDSPRWAPVQDERRQELIRALEYTATVRLLGADELPNVSPVIGLLAIRNALYPAYALVWTDEVVAPKVEIYPEDIAFYIREHTQQFFVPERLQFYWAFFPSPLKDPPERRREVREAAERIRQDLVNAGVSLVTVAADYPPTTTLVPTDLLYTAPVGSNYLDPLVETAIRDGLVRQISPVTESKDGFHLVELRGRLPPIPRPEEDIRQEARQRLFTEFLPEQFVHRLAQVRRVVHPVDRTSLWPFLAENTVLLDIGRTDVTKGNFRALFPDIAANEQTIDIDRIRAKSQEFIDGEVIAQDVEKHVLDSDSLLLRSRPAAEAIVGFDAWQRRIAREFQTPSDERIQSLWNEKRNVIFPPYSRHYYRLTATLTPLADTVSPQEQGRRMGELLSALQQFRTEAVEILSAYLTSSPPGEPLDSALILTRWQRHFGRSYQIAHEDLGFRVAQQPGPFPGPLFDVPPLAVGEASTPRFEQPGVLALYFVVQERQRETPPPAEIRRLVIEHEKQLRLAEEANRMLDAAVREGQFTFAPALKP